MPELPEVETIVRSLRPQITGKRILALEVRGRRVLRKEKSLPQFEKIVLGKVIRDLHRRGKNIIFELSGGTSLVLHLMMSGRLLLNPKMGSKHDRLIICLSAGRRLVFNDIRQFGWCRILGKEEKLVGPDALSVGIGEFKKSVASRRGVVKNVLLDQKIISGIGNIYADEILWYAGIKPTRRAVSLTELELKKFYQAMRYVLQLAVKKEGTSSRDYRKPDGTKGGYYKIRKAYQRSGEKCSRDGAVIKRIKIGSRSAHFCPKHQK